MATVTAPTKEVPTKSRNLVEMNWDPITRIVGSLGIFTKIDFENRRVAECHSTSSIFRGYSIFMTLTDEEKREMRESDVRARQILERTESLPVDQLMKLHGVLRGLRAVTDKPCSPSDQERFRPQRSCSKKISALAAM